MYILTPATSFVAGWMESFKEFPPRMKPGSFSLDRVMEAATSGKK
jgi:arylsulfatase